MDDQVMVPVPQHGRLFRRSRRVRLGDVSPGGRLRLDAFARYLQDVSSDDVRDAGGDNEMSWVVRRTVVEARQFACFDEEIELATFCGGLGSRWAERRVVVRGGLGAAMDAATIWVHLDPVTMAAKRLPASFHALYAEAAAGRTVRARLHHPEPPAGASVRAWPLRFVDFDVLKHMNNTAYWIPVEEELARRRDLRAPLRAEVEFRTPIERGDDLHLVTLDDPRSLTLWLVADGAVRASARVLALDSARS